MRNPATYRRAAAAVCLALTGVLSAVFVMLATAPGWDSSQVERLEAVADAGTAGTASFLVFAVYQLPLVIGLLGVSHLLRGTAPLLANLIATLGCAGGFGYAIYGGSQLVVPAMAADRANLQTHARIRDDAESLTGVFAAVGMVGFVLAVLLLSIALWRTRLGHRAIPVLLWGFLVVEFVGTGLLPGAALVSASLLLTAFSALALVVGRSPAVAWTSGTDQPAARPDDALTPAGP